MFWVLLIFKIASARYFCPELPGVTVVVNTYNVSTNNKCYPENASELEHDKISRKILCAQRRLRSALASTQFDPSLHCPHEESLGSYTHRAHCKDADQTKQIPRLI